MYLRARATSPTPDLVLVPPTPVNRIHPDSGSPSSSPSASSAPPTPELTTTEERSSSETIEIYSMYDGDNGRSEELRHPSRKETHSSNNSHGSSAYFSAFTASEDAANDDSPYMGIEPEVIVDDKRHIDCPAH